MGKNLIELSLSSVVSSFADKFPKIIRTTDSMFRSQFTWEFTVRAWNIITIFQDSLKPGRHQKFLFLP